MASQFNIEVFTNEALHKDEAAWILDAVGFFF